MQKKCVARRGRFQPPAYAGQPDHSWCISHPSRGGIPCCADLPTSQSRKAGRRRESDDGRPPVALVKTGASAQEGRETPTIPHPTNPIIQSLVSFTLPKQIIIKNPNKSAYFTPKTNLVARCTSYVNKMCLLRRTQTKAGRS